MDIIIGIGQVGKIVNNRMNNDNVLFYDNDRRKWGTIVDDTRVIGLDELLDLKENRENRLIIGADNPSLLCFIKDMSPKCGVYRYEENKFIEISTEDIKDFEYDNAEKIGEQNLKKYICRMEELKKEGREKAYQHAKAYVEFKKENIHLPEISSIELTNNCNLSCPNCPNSSLTFHKGYISDEIFEEALKYIPPYKEDTVAVHCMGEPLLHPRLFDYLEKMVEIGANICMSTNGILLDESIDKRLLEIFSKTDKTIFYISFHTLKSVEKWNEFLKVYEKCECKEKINFFGQVLEHNEEEAHRWLEEIGCFEYGTHPHIRHITSHSWGGNVLSRRKEYEEVEIKNRIRNCYYLRQRKIAVMWDGSLRGCCFDSNATQKCGNIMDYEKSTIDPHGYDLCRFCDPDWITSYQ